MTTKTTSRKTTASARPMRKKPNVDAPKSTKTATAAKSEKTRAPKAEMTARSDQGEITAKAAKPAEARTKAAARRGKKEGAPQKKAKADSAKAKADSVAAQPEILPSAPARPSRDAIAARAAALWRQHGGPAFDNWIRAERELGA